MAAKRTYDTINGQIIAETSGGATSNYVLDALGSVTGVTQKGSISGAARYSPFGRTIAGSSGATMGYVGAWGYYPTGRAFGSHYVRARVFDKTTGSWTTVDPIWPGDTERGYGRDNPTTRVDPSGLLSCTTAYKFSHKCNDPAPAPGWTYFCAFQWVIDWDLPPGPKPGAIVQRVTLKETRANCADIGKPPHPRIVEWFEEWEWDGSKLLGGKCKGGRPQLYKEDTWEAKPFNCRCKFTMIEVTAKACFISPFSSNGWRPGVGEISSAVWLPGSAGPALVDLEPKELRH